MENNYQIGVLFVCHGNICRSPMAEFYFKWLIGQEGMASRFRISSAATSREEIGNPVYPPAREELLSHGITCEGKRAEQLTRQMYEENDYVIVMDGNNLHNVERMFGKQSTEKVRKLLSFAKDTTRLTREDVADPWYTGNFHQTWEDIELGCKALLKYILKKRELQIAIR